MTSQRERETERDREEESQKKEKKENFELFFSSRSTVLWFLCYEWKMEKRERGKVKGSWGMSKTCF